MPEDRPVGYYHCISRVVDRRFIFDTPEKEHFVALMRELEEFCDVQVLTYAVLSNHFHILTAVPHRPERLPSAEVVLAKLAELSGHQNVEAVRQELEMHRRHGDAEGEGRLLGKYYGRMWDVSTFMGLLKQRFTQWYNGRRGRKGTLWEERFKSVVVDGAGEALATMAAYIDLNAVRAGMVEDPKDYRWCGYGEALAGKKRAKVGLQEVVKALPGGKEESLSGSLAVYRMHLFNEGREERESVNEEGKLVRGALSREAAVKVLEEKGRLPAQDYVRCRVRYFCDGAVLGTREFVEEMFGVYRGWFGKKRKDGARRMRGIEEELYTMRDLRLRVFG